MKTSSQLLEGILHTIQKIDQRLSKPTGAPGGKSEGIGNISGNIKKTVTKKPSDKSKPKTSGLIVDLMHIYDNVDAKKLGNVAENLGVISSSLPKLAVGMTALAVLKHVALNAAISTLDKLFQTFNRLGDPKSSKNIDRSVKSLSGIGTALYMMVKPLNRIPMLLMKLGVSFVAFAGGLFLAGKILGTSPVEAVGVIGLVIGGMALAFSILGNDKVAKHVTKGSAVATGMGIGMASLSLGIIAFALTMVAVPAIMGIGGQGAGAIGLGLLVIIGIIGGMALAFAGLGWADTAIMKGVVIAGAMAGGMALLALGVLSIALVSTIIAASYNASKFDTVTSSSKQGTTSALVKNDDKMSILGGLGVMGAVLLGAVGLFALMGAAAPVLLPGLGMAILVAGTMVLTALAVKKLNNIAKTMNGVEVQENISMLLSSTLMGFSDGISKGLLGEKSGSDTPWYKKLGGATLNAAKIVAGVSILTGISVSLSLFASSLKAFAMPGSIRTIIGTNADGTSKLSDPVNIVDVSRNIATSITTFFTTMSDLFKGDQLPSPAEIGLITNLLMGSGGLKLFGFDVLRYGPNLMDALLSFGNVLSFWGKFADQGTVALGTDDEGKPIQGPKTVVVAKLIGNTIGSFMKTLVKQITDDNGDMPNMDELSKIAGVLMGTGGLKVFGFNVGQVGPNLMDALIKFGSVLKYWGQFGEKGELPGEVGEDGKPKAGVKLTTVAKNIAVAVGGFMKHLSTEIPNIGKRLQPQIALMAKILLGEQASGLWKFLGTSSDVPGILEPVSKFADVIKQFASGKISMGTDANGNPIYEKIDYAKTAQNIVKAISGFTISLSKGLAGLSSSDANFEDKALDAGEFIGKFESMFSKLETLSNASTGLDKLATSLTNVGSGLGVIAENLERMDADKLQTAIEATGDYQQKTAFLPDATQNTANTAQNTSKSAAVQPVDWDSISLLIGEQVGLQVSNALRGGQFKFEFDTTKTGGVYYWDPS
jgi:hypothetical protein